MIKRIFGVLPIPAPFTSPDTADPSLLSPNCGCGCEESCGCFSRAKGMVNDNVVASLM
jgi:hypothetical protein